MKRAALYVRVSTEEQKKHGYSVDSQIDALQKYCKENNMAVVNIYNDAGISARKKYTRRPALLQMIEDCQDKKIDIVLFTKLDRFFRSVPDYYACVEQMAGVPWKAIWEDYETETSAGVFKVNIMLSVAQSEADRTGERIKAVNEYRKSQGFISGGTAPLGYKFEKPFIVKDEKAAPVIDAFFKKYLATFSVTEAYKVAKEMGYTFSTKRCRCILTNPTYSGTTPNGINCYAYITKEQYDLILQSVESRKVRRAPRNRVYIFSGILKCGECGSNLTGFQNRCSVNGKAYKYSAYRCPKHHLRGGCSFGKAIFESKIEAYLINNIDESAKNRNTTIDMMSKESNDIAKKIKALKSRLVRIGDRYEDGDISKDEYREKRDKIKFEIQKMEEIAKIPKRVSFEENWKVVYNELDKTHKKAFWNKAINKIIVNGKTDFDIIFNS